MTADLDLAAQCAVESRSCSNCGGIGYMRDGNPCLHCNSNAPAVYPPPIIIEDDEDGWPILPQCLRRT